MENKQGVKFIRVRGRIVPIKMSKQEVAKRRKIALASTATMGVGLGLSLKDDIKSVIDITRISLSKKILDNSLTIKVPEVQKKFAEQGFIGIKKSLDSLNRARRTKPVAAGLFGLGVGGLISLGHSARGKTKEERKKRFKKAALGTVAGSAAFAGIEYANANNNYKRAVKYSSDIFKALKLIK